MRGETEAKWATNRKAEGVNIAGTDLGTSGWLSAVGRSKTESWGMYDFKAKQPPFQDSPWRGRGRILSLEGE